MISREKWTILIPLLKLPNNVCNLGKIIAATGFEKLPMCSKSPNLVTLDLPDAKSWNIKCFKQIHYVSKLLFGNSNLRICFLNGPIPASFRLFSSFPHDTNQIHIDKSIDGVLGTRTRGGRMEGAGESTELWRHPILRICCMYYNPIQWAHLGFTVLTAVKYISDTVFY